MALLDGEVRGTPDSRSRQRNDVLPPTGGSTQIAGVRHWTGLQLTRTTHTQSMTGGVVPVGVIAPGELPFARGAADAPEHVAMATGYGCVVNGPGLADPSPWSSKVSWARSSSSGAARAEPADCGCGWPAVGTHAERVFVEFIAVNAASTRVEWRLSLDVPEWAKDAPYPLSARVAASSGRVALLTVGAFKPAGRTTYAIDLVDHRVLWTRDLLEAKKIVKGAVVGITKDAIDSRYEAAAGHDLNTGEQRWRGEDSDGSWG
ncbi:hypothetical protein ACFZBM_31375 [Streptomyces lavendulae]|uniref:hypothetical protein n=1 Tax=Streptomyces lavendulae TaxID=1914 RepID=UPI0036E059EA